ncbi:MAG: DUF1801 domain-containing protein [Thermoplasmatota archaeon]
MPATKRAAPKAPTRTAAQGKVAHALPGAPTGKASAAKAEVGDAPVKAYIASLPPAQRAIAKRIDALAARTLPDLQRSVKWGMAFYGVGNGWCFSCGGFTDHVKVTFLHGTALKPVPPVGTGKYTRGVDLESVADIDERQIASWMEQASARPGLGAEKKQKTEGDHRMTFRLKDPKKRNPKVEAILSAGSGDAADAGRWLADLVRSTVKDSEEDVYHRMPTWAVKDGVGFAHVSIYSKHASLGFTRGARLDDKDGLFEPSASSTYRAVKVSAPGAVPKAKLVRLLKQAASVAREESA